MRAIRFRRSGPFQRDQPHRPRTTAAVQAAADHGQDGRDSDGGDEDGPHHPGSLAQLGSTSVT